MTLRPLGFRRVVLGLQPGVPSSATELAVELASLLDLELIGLFIDDVALRHCAAMPAARAISALGAAWNSLEFAHEPGEADYAAEIAGRRFAVASERLERRRFEIVRGAAGRELTTISRPEDILVIVPPAAAADRVAEPFASLLEAAFASPAAVMLTPRRIAHAAGSIVAIAAAPDDFERRRRRRNRGRDGRKPSRNRHAPGRQRDFAGGTEERHGKSFAWSDPQWASRLPRRSGAIRSSRAEGAPHSAKSWRGQ